MPSHEAEKNVVAAKQALRARQIGRRRAALAGVREAVAGALAEAGARLLERWPGAVVAGYHPMTDEIDCLPLLQRLAEGGWQTALPVIGGRGQALTFRAWRPGEPLTHGTWGIGEPLPTAPEVAPGVVLTPLLAFDGEGYRLGYGGGYYDRTLAALRQRGEIAAVGIALDELEVDAVPHLVYDQRLDWVLTQTHTRRFRASSMD